MPVRERRAIARGRARPAGSDCARRCAAGSPAAAPPCAAVRPIGADTAARTATVRPHPGRPRLRRPEGQQACGWACAGADAVLRRGAADRGQGVGARWRRTSDWRSVAVPASITLVARSHARRPRTPDAGSCGCIREVLDALGLRAWDAVHDHRGPGQRRAASRRPPRARPGEAAGRRRDDVQPRGRRRRPSGRGPARCDRPRQRAAAPAPGWLGPRWPRRRSGWRCIGKVVTRRGRRVAAAPGPRSQRPGSDVARRARGSCRRAIGPRPGPRSCSPWPAHGAVAARWPGGPSRPWSAGARAAPRAGTVPSVAAGGGRRRAAGGPAAAAPVAGPRARRRPSRAAAGRRPRRQRRRRARKLVEWLRAVPRPARAARPGSAARPGWACWSPGRRGSARRPWCAVPRAAVSAQCIAGRARRWPRWRPVPPGSGCRT